MKTDALDSSFESVATVAAFCLRLVEASRDPRLGLREAEELAEATQRVAQALKVRMGELQDQGVHEDDICILQRLSGAVALAAEIAMPAANGTHALRRAPLQSRRCLN